MKIAIKYVEYDTDHAPHRGKPISAIEYCDWEEDGEPQSANVLLGDEIPDYVREELALIIAPWLCPSYGGNRD